MPEDATLEANEKRAAEKRDLIIKEIDTAIRTASKAFVKPANAAIAKLSKKGEQWEYPLAFALLENMKAQQVAMEPAFIADPRNEDGETIQPVIEKLLNNYSHELRFRQMAEEASDWVGWTGLALAKVGYTVVGETVEPWAMSFDPRNFFPDTYCTKTDLSDARYCGEIRTITKAEALNDDNYHPDLVEKVPINRVGGDYVQDEDNRFGRETGLPNQYGLIKIREMHLRDPETGIIQVGAHAEGQKELVRDFDNLPEIFKLFNYVPLIFFPVVGNFYGQSILSKVEAVCNQLDMALGRISDRWDKNPEKFIVFKQGLAKGGMEALMNGETFNFVEAEGDVGKVVDFLHGQIIYNDEMAFLRYLIELFQWISGMTYMQLGSGSSRTATEAGIVGQSSDMRSSRRMNVMERWMSGIGYRLWVICRHQMKFIPYKEILGPKLAKVWEDYENEQSKREKIENDTDISVRMSLPINTAAIHRRDKNLEFIRRISDEGIQVALQRQGEMIDMKTILNGIARDTGFHKGVTVPIPQAQAQAEGEGAE